MKLHASIADDTLDVDVRREGDRVFAKVGDRNYELGFQRTRDSYLLVCDGAVFDCRVEGQPKSGEAVDVFVGTSHSTVTLADPKRLRGCSGADAHADGAARIIASMPGKVVRVLAEQGAQVEAGAGIIVVEAMKMQNEMKSPRTGTVTSINIEVGATVNGGDVLAVIE